MAGRVLNETGPGPLPVLGRRRPSTSSESSAASLAHLRPLSKFSAPASGITEVSESGGADLCAERCGASIDSFHFTQANKNVPALFNIWAFQDDFRVERNSVNSSPHIFRHFRRASMVSHWAGSTVLSSSVSNPPPTDSPPNYMSSFSSVWSRRVVTTRFMQSPSVCMCV